MAHYNTIAESKNFIVLDRYTKLDRVYETYQSEDELERELIQDLQSQGYAYLHQINTAEKLLALVREQLQHLNKVQFSEAEWQRFLSEYLDRPGDGILDKTRKIHDDHALCVNVRLHQLILR
ncbi:MAG: type I restriction endonuclease [Desulfomicrobium sp.]|nr:type I restriction endonuclease [Desulfomicrobium sp.]